MERRDRGYYFDPTANKALARVARQEQYPGSPGERVSSCPDIYHASIEEITLLRGHTYEPEKLRGRNYFRKQIRRTFEERKKAERRMLK